MRPNYLKATLKTAVLAVTILLLGAGVSFGQTYTVNLTAQPTQAVLPDGTTVPMWGYACGAAPAAPASCAALNSYAGTNWSPVVITVPAGTTTTPVNLTINLTNSLSFANGNSVPTSLVIVGQLGGGLGTPEGSTTSPPHGAQGATWPVADPTVTNTPPTQGPRVRSFGMEVAAGATTGLTWNALKPGTYLIESGTHPSIQGSMGLYGILVVTTAPAGTTAGTAYPAGARSPVVNYDADIPLLLSEIDPVQNNYVSAAVNTSGFSETEVWSGRVGACGDITPGAPHTCYPPAVNYAPLYYLINGAAFDKTKITGATNPSLFAVSPATVTMSTNGGVLVRIVNAGLRMHVPSIVGAQTGDPAAPTGGFSLIAEDGNVLPGVRRVQSEVFMAAGKTYDVMINVPASATAPALPIFDRQLSLSGNATARDAGMLAYISINGAGLPGASALAAATATPDTYNSVISGKTLTVSDPAKGVIANDVNIYGVKVLGTVAGLALNTDGTFTYTGGPTSFTYCGNGAISGPACAVVNLNAAPIELSSGITCTIPTPTYSSTVATTLSIKPPGILSFCKDAAGYPLTVTPGSVSALSGGGTVSVDPNGGFTASGVSGAGSRTFTFQARNSQGTDSSTMGPVTLAFPSPSNLAVTLIDGKTNIALSGNPQDYRWIIEEDRTFYIDPTTQTNTGGTTITTVVPTYGTNFHSSYMPIVAQGCTGPLSCESGQSVLGVPSVCDVGNGVCRSGSAKTAVLPGQVALDPAKRYYISVLPGDAIGVDAAGADLPASHGMGGAQIAAGQTSVRVIVEPQGAPPAKLSVFVFRDDHPLNGEHDAGGGIDILSPNEAGLGGFNITIFDDVGGTGDAAGQMTYDEFNQPLSNALAGMTDPTNPGVDACPISTDARVGFDNSPGGSGLRNGVSDKGITGVIPVCPKFEADGVTLSPLAGQAVVANLPPGRYGIVATPGAERIAKGEEWLQTNTLDGGKAHDSFLKISEPSYFQEFGPAGYHVSIGFANPDFIRAAGTALCAANAAATPPGPACTNTVRGKVTGVHMSRPSDERLYSTGSRDTFGYTQCYASLGSPDGADISFAKCADDGTFELTGIPAGDWRVTIFDQWNDQIVDGISTPVRVNAPIVDMQEVAVHAWKQNLYTRTCFDVGATGLPGPGYHDGVCQANEPGLTLVPTNIRFRDGSFSNFNSADLEGFAGFNEIFPLFNWYLLETDSTRYKNTGTHVVNDAGGPVDGTTGGGTSTILANLANTVETNSLPVDLRFPGSVYCSNADCTGFSIAAPPANGGPGGSTGRIDPPWVTSYGWQGFAGQNQYVEFGKAPFAEKTATAPAENGGVRGHVVYTSTRPFDDPALLLQLSWEPLVPHVTINLYQVGTAQDLSRSLTMVDTTTTSSWDDWAQGFWPGTSPAKPYMSCPGQASADPFIFTLNNQPNYLNPGTPLPYNSRYKCYDGLHNWAQLQPAPYDGMYQFPSIIGRDATTGVPTGTGSTNGTPGSRTGSNCTICVANPVDGTPMLPAGRYLVEMVVPTGYELVKEEDKNILLGDTYEAPVTQQFLGFGNIFIMPDQASVAASYNPNNPLIPTTDLGAQPRHEGDTGSIETFWPCVGAIRVVPDFMSLFPGSGQNAPFAGASRPLCDRKEVVLEDQMSVLAKFYVFTSAHVAGHFTGVITDDFTSEFDPFSPHFGEKFSPANLPVSVKDWAGKEISRVYSDQWGIYDGLNYSTFSVNPPDPSGYIPNMMVMCMNDRGGIGTAPSDPLYQSSYSQFCYELPFMPGQTGYFDTPVIPTTAFAEGYNHPDCAYPDATPAISEVDGDGIGPWIATSGTTHPITIHALGNQDVNNYGYSGPSATTSPFNAKTITRHYGFGATQGTGSVTIGGVTATVSSWSDATIVATLPSSGTQVPLCMQQRGASANRCGELIVTAANGKKSIDAVTVTIGGGNPTHIPASGSIQSFIDAATPGALLIVDPTCPTTTGACTASNRTTANSPTAHNEMVIMWKPVRLQGVGAASSIINADPHPAAKLDPWRRQVVCLFGLALNGTPINTNNPYDPDGTFNCTTTGANAMQGRVDRLPLEATVGWDALLNGNLAEQLQEPTLMGTYEGAGITVLAKGVRFPAGSNPFAADTFPDGTQLLMNLPVNNANCTGNYTSNFICNPSRIDGLTVTNSSQGGGGIFVHAWAHNLEIANNRVTNNQGSLSGGIVVGQGEHPDAYLAGAANPAPGSCQTSIIPNTALPLCFDVNVKVHHNAITLNSNEGDELFSATPSGGGGVSFCTGADNYKFNYNWVCGNFSTGDGGGVAQLGFVYQNNDSDRGIQHNAILFNQSTNPTRPANGGGILIMSAPDTDPTCPGEPDADCALSFGSVSEGTGPNLLINANLILGNSAEAGSGGGLRFQGVNGAEVGNFPGLPFFWYEVNVTNNIIANNVAGWDGAGVSLQDSLKVNLINNTIVENDSTASSGALFGGFFAPQASAPHPDPCNSPACGTVSSPQAAGLVTAQHSAEFTASLPPTITCPPGHPLNPSNILLGVVNGACRTVSYPVLFNDVFWQNRAFHIEVAPLSPQYQQATVTLVPAMNQTSTGACVTSPAPTYWDIGVRGDTGPTNHGPVTLSPQSSFLTNTAGYPGGASGFRANSSANPTFFRQYCNGSRVPPENGGLGYIVPPGTNEGNVPVPVFNLQAGATVDEGNNWINMSWGPLSLASPVDGTVLGNFALQGGSTAINYVGPLNSTASYLLAPSDDFFGNPRKTGATGNVDAGAIESQGGAAAAVANVTGGPLNFGNVAVGTTSEPRNLTLHNTGTATLTGISVAISAGPFGRVTGGTFPAGAPNCGATLAAGSNCTIKVAFSPTAVGPASGTVTINASVPVTGSPVNLGGTGATTTASLTPATQPFGTVPRGVLVQNAPVFTFTLTNTGSVTLTAIASPTITVNPTNFRVLPTGTTCGTINPNPGSRQTSLAPGQSCSIRVRFNPPLSDAANSAQSGTLSITDSAGTQTASLTGTAQ